MMIKNIGNIDRTLRLLLGLFLVWLGIFVLNGKEGNVIGIYRNICSSYFIDAILHGAH
jgi:hypothetical protein